MKLCRVAGALAAVCLFSALGQNPPATPVGKPAAAPKFNVDKAKLEAYVRHLLIWGPQINVAIAEPRPAPLPGYAEVKVTGSYQAASLDEIFYVSPDGQKMVRGAVYDINSSPFANELSKLKTDLSPSLGTPGAPVVLVVFTDFQCPYCREEAKMMRENLIKAFPTQVRLYFKEFPLEQIHPWAKPAAIAGRCVFRQDPLRFWDYHDWIFDIQKDVTAENLKGKLTEWVQSKGLDSMQFARCYDNRATEADVNRSTNEARELKVTSTPTIFVNGRALPGSTAWPQLKAIIEWELDYSKKTGQAVEKCCEVSLPMPGKP